MPVKEVDLQTELKNAVIDAGGYAYKQSNRFLVGVLDLFVQLPTHPTVILEVKYENKYRADGSVKIELSPHQVRNMGNINKAGGVAGWIMLVRRGPGEYEWIVGRSQPIIPVKTTSATRHLKLKGQPWPIEAIIKEVIRSC